jgi:hypothetical protein
MSKDKIKIKQGSHAYQKLKASKAMLLILIAGEYNKQNKT